MIYFSGMSCGMLLQMWLLMSFQVSQLRLENTTIMKRVTEITLKFQEAAVENRVLKADVATLQAKVIDFLPWCNSDSIPFCTLCLNKSVRIVCSSKVFDPYYCCS
jgi:hypothetical protein